MDDLNPITRTERLLDGEDLTPINREEMFIKRIYDKTQEVPEPVNRKEYFLKKAGEAGGDITVESLSVTSNGIYTAPSGKAYTPVNVSVQPPANSYQLKSITTPTSLATFEASAMPMPTLKVSVEAKQDLSHGAPSPTNICPISGWDNAIVTDTGINLFDKTTAAEGFIDDTTGEVNSNPNYKCTDYICVNGGNSYYVKSEQSQGMWGAWYDDNKDYISPITNYVNQVITAPQKAKYVRLTILTSSSGSLDTFAVNYPSTDHDYHAYNGNTYPISWQTEAGIVYFGYIDFISGELVATNKGVDMGDLEWSYNSNYSKFSVSIVDKRIVEVSEYLQQSHLLCSILNPTLMIKSLGNDLPDMSICEYTSSTSSNSVIVRCSDYTDAALFKTAMTGQTLVYELATPITYQLTPTLIKSLNGTNNLSVDCGEILEGEYFKALGGE